MKKWIGLLAAMVFSSVSFAGTGGALVSVGVLKYNQENDGPTIGHSETKNTFYDVKIGYVTASEVYLGGIYSVANYDYGSSENKRTLYGVSIGYHHNGWYLDGSYFIDGQYDVGSLVFKKASGIGVDFGYHFFPSTNLAIGLQGSYKTFAFKEYESSSGATVTEENKVKSEMYPMLVIGVLF